MIIGGPGAGKSTLAVKLGTATGLPVFHADLLCGPRPGRKKQEQIKLLLDEVQQQETWIIDGLFSDFDMRIARADTVLFLDLARVRRFLNCLFRWYKGNAIAEDPTTTRNVYLKTLWQILAESREFNCAVRQAIVARQSEVKILQFRNRGATLVFLKSVVTPIAADHGN